MIRAHAKVTLPAHLHKTVRDNRHSPFEHIELARLVPSVAKHVPYAFERQRHSIVVLGGGWCEPHIDDIEHVIDTCYAVPIRLAKHAELGQGEQFRALECGRIYSFNQRIPHEVRTPSRSKGCSAFLIVDVYTRQQATRLSKAANSSGAQTQPIEKDPDFEQLPC